jgi:ADP-ribose pyrophosphatase YjhB (NUDIX family)
MPQVRQLAWEGVAVLCRSADGRSLLMVLQGRPHETPTWAVPGGALEPGETPEGAALRETREETGLEVRILRPYGVFEGVGAYGAYRVHYYQAEVVGGRARASDPDGLIRQVAWVPFSRLPDLCLSHEDLKRVLSAFMGEETEPMDDSALWKLTQEAIAAIVPHYEPVFERFADESGLDGPTWGLLLAALTFEPETTSPARLHVRGPYTAAEGYLARLAAAAEKGYLVQVAPGEYRLTDVGRTQTERLVEEARGAMAAADPFPPADAGRLVGLLDRLVEASLGTPPPPDTWSIRLSHMLMPAPEPPLPYIEQAISCLAGYRDDAHLAAWQPSGLSATALETLTLLWRGEADALDAVCERLARRGHPPRIYVAALAELRERGFVEGTDDAPQVTETGRRFREMVEADTDRYFFTPWACLDDAEKAESGDLLTRLRDGLGGAP